jgi:hypothetical protein
MAQPIPLEIPPRNPRAELRSRLEQAAEEHAEAVLAGYEVLQQLHNRGVLEILRGALAASDEILEKVVDNARTPEAIRAIRNLLFGAVFLGASSRNGFRGFFRQFRRESHKRRRSEINRSASWDYFGAPSAKIVSAVWLQLLTSCKLLGAISTPQRIGRQKLRATP